MSANGKSGEGGGDEDADDEDGINGKIKASESTSTPNPMSNPGSECRSRQPTTSSIHQASSKQSTPVTLLPAAQGLVHQPSAIHPSMPPIIPTHPTPNRTLHPTAQPDIGSNLKRALERPKNAGAHKMPPHHPPTISIPSPPRNTSLPIARHPEPRAAFYGQQPQPQPHAHHEMSPQLQPEQRRPQYAGPPHATQYNPPAYPTYPNTHNQQPQHNPYYSPNATVPRPAINSPSLAQSSHRYATQISTAAPSGTPSDITPGPNRMLLNPGAQPGNPYQSQTRQPFQAATTSPYQVNQGLLTPQISSTQSPTQNVHHYPQQQYSEQAQYSSVTPQPIQFGAQSIKGTQITSQYSGGQRHDRPNAGPRYHQPGSAPVVGYTKPLTTNQPGNIPINAPQGSFFNPAAAAFSASSEQEPVPQSHQANITQTDPTQGSSRILELQNELLFKKKKEMWKYKRKKKKKGDGTGTGTEDSQDSQEDSGSVTSGGESATGRLSHSSTSTALPHQASFHGQQTPLIHESQARTAHQVPMLNYQVNDSSKSVVSNDSTIVNKPSSASAAYSATAMNQQYRNPTPINLQYRSEQRPHTPTSLVAGWVQPAVTVASSQLNPQVISATNQRQRYPSPQVGQQYGQQLRGYPPMGNSGGVPRSPSPYNAYGQNRNTTPYYPVPHQVTQQQGGESMHRMPHDPQNPAMRHISPGPPSYPSNVRSQGGNIGPQRHQYYPNTYYQGNSGAVANTTNPSMGYGSPGRPFMQQNQAYPLRAGYNQSQAFYAPRPNGSTQPHIVPPIKTENIAQCTKEHTYGLCDLCGHCGPPPPVTTALSSYENCTNKHGEGLCSQCGYVGVSSSNAGNNMAKNNSSSKPVLPKLGDSDDDDSNASSDSSDGYNSFYKNRKPISGGVKSHAELVAVLTKKTKKKNLPANKNSFNQSATQSHVVQSNSEARLGQMDRGAYNAGANKTITKPPKRPTSLSAVKFHKSHTINLNQEFDELLAELDFMEKTNKMHPTVFRSYGPKGTFDKSSGRIQAPAAPLVTKKTLAESIKTVTKKLEDKDSDFTASEVEAEESSDTITEEEESSEDAPIIIKRKEKSKKPLGAKHKYEYDSDYSVSKEDLKMMKSLKKSTARLENPEYESEEESPESESDDKNDEDWSNADLSEDDIPLLKKKIKDRRRSPEPFRPRKIRGEDLSIDMNIDYQVSTSRSESGSKRRLAKRQKRQKEKRMKRRNVIVSDDDEDDSDIPIGRNRKLKSRKCRDEFSEEYSSSDTEKSSSSSESNIQRRKHIRSSEKPSGEQQSKSAQSSSSKDADISEKKKGNDDNMESEAAKTFDEYEEVIEERRKHFKRRRLHRRSREQGYPKYIKAMTNSDHSTTTNQRFVNKMRHRCRPFLKREMLPAFRKVCVPNHGKTWKSTNIIETSWKSTTTRGLPNGASLSPKVVLKSIDLSKINLRDSVNKDNSNNLTQNRQILSKSEKRMISDDNGDSDLIQNGNHRRSYAQRISDSDESSVSIGNGMISGSQDTKSEEGEGRVRRALSFSEMSSSNDVPQRPRSPKRKGNLSKADANKQTNLRRPLVLHIQQNYDEGDESERSIQEARSPKRSSKAGVKSKNVDNFVQDNTNAISSSMQLSSSGLGAKGGVKRGKPEPLTPNRSPEKKNDEEGVPWLLRENLRTPESGSSRQRHILRDAFERNEFPSMQDLMALEEKTKMPTKKIIHWFQQARKIQRSEEKSRELRRQEREFMNTQNETNGYCTKEISNGNQNFQKLNKTPSSQSLYSCGGADSESSGDFRGFDSDTNQGTLSY